jgi:cbb3-type cytochrome oxidase subunit 3
VHRTAWFTDLALGTLFFSLCYFVAGLFHHFRKTEPKQPENRSTGSRAP